MKNMETKQDIIAKETVENVNNMYKTGLGM